MNQLPLEKRGQVLSMLVEGSCVRSVSRVAHVSINTVAELVADAGEAFEVFLDRTVRSVPSKRVQCGGIWAFDYCEQRTVAIAKATPEVARDLWMWTALDAWTTPRFGGTGAVAR